VTTLSLVATHAAAAWAQSRAADSSLPIGSPLTIVSDEAVKPGVRPGSEFRAHLRDPIQVGATLVAVAGTPARIIVVSKETGATGAVSYRIAIDDLKLGLAGILPVRPDSPVVDTITAGLEIPAATLATVDVADGKVRVDVPLPFPLSNEPPASDYTPAPLRTANPALLQPRGGRRRPGASPSPTPSPSSAPGNASPQPGASGSPSPAPSATPTPEPPNLGPYPQGSTPPPAGTPVFPSPTPPGPPGAVPTPPPTP